MWNDARRSLEALVSRLRPRLRSILAWVGGILLAYAVVGFFVAPPLVRPALERSLSETLDRKVTIARLDINPFALSATLHDLVVGSRGDGPPLLTLHELHAGAAITSLFRLAPVVSALKLTQPVLRLVRNDDKSYNFSDLIERSAAKPGGPPPRFLLTNIEVVDGRIEFDDRPDHRQHVITNMNIGIPFLSSLPAQAEIRVEPKFSALVNGRPVEVSGESRPFMGTHETVLHLDLGDLPLPAYIEYVPVPLPVKVESGIVGAKVDLRFVGHGSDPPELTLAGTLRLADLAVSERSGAKLLRVPSLTATIDKLDLVGNSAELRTIAAEGVDLEVRRDARGELNLAALYPAGKKPAKEEKPYRFRAGSIVLGHGTLRLADAEVAPAFASTLTDVSLEVTNLASTADQKANVSLSFLSDTGARLSHRGTLALSPVRADGRVEMTGFKLARLFPYYASALNLTVDDGTLDGSTEFHFDGGAAGAGLTLTGLDATASNLRMRLPDEKDPLWRVPVLAVHGGSVDVSRRAIAFEAVESHGAIATVRRDAQGRFNFERLIRTPAGGATAAPTESTGATPPGGTGPAAAASAAAAPAGETWRVEARKVALDDYAASFTDETVTPPARVALSRVSANGENISNAANSKGRATLQATVNKRGTLSLSGPIVAAPFAATLNVAAKDIDLVPFQPYVSQSARVVVTGGTVTARGSVDFASGPPRRAAYKGDVVLGEVAMLDEANEADLLKWKSLALTGVDAQLEPLAVSVGDIALDTFFARLLLNENGEFNLQQLARNRPAASAPPTPTLEPKTVEVATPPGTGATWLKLGKATLTAGNVDFTDHFIRPNYSANLTGLTGNLSSLAFDQPADIELRANVQGSAPVQITGRINPLAQNLFLDLKASATDIELSPLSPYSGKYVGYGIEKGKLSMKVSYLIEDRKLKAENSIILNQLTFGQKVESPDAIKAPVLLAVSLLKDRNGVIQFDLPVGGSLDDPQFSVGGLVFRAVVNLIVRIVTAPFAILGSLGGHGEELAYIEFAPGSAALDKTGGDKLKGIAKVLNERPAIKLDVAGRVDPAQDRDGLKRAALERQLKQQKFNDLMKSGEPPGSVAAVEVPPAEYDALLLRVYRAAEFPKPRNAIGIPKDLSREEMEALLLTNAKVGEEDLRSLADSRAEVVRTGLIEGEHVPGERVFLVAPRLDAEGVKDKGKTTRVDFALH
jgi:uncharacterized protein involved in outer membrane biogenesis